MHIAQRFACQRRVQACSTIQLDHLWNMVSPRNKATLSEDNRPYHAPRKGWQGRPSQECVSRKNADSNEDINKSTTTSELKGQSHKYDSLKVYREGPNTESGELDPQSDSQEVKKHNKSVADRNDSR